MKTHIPEILFFSSILLLVWSYFHQLLSERAKLQEFREASEEQFVQVRKIQLVSPTAHPISLLLCLACKAGKPIQEHYFYYQERINQAGRYEDQRQKIFSLFFFRLLLVLIFSLGGKILLRGTQELAFGKFLYFICFFWVSLQIFFCKYFSPIVGFGSKGYLSELRVG